ncbi:MAG: glycosyltransferase family 1 protein [Pseudomonadota bacterium]
MTTYYFDVTDIARFVTTNKTVSGIQRVAIMVIHEMAAELGQSAMRLTYFDDRKGRHVALSAEAFLGLTSFEMFDVASALGLAPAGAARVKANPVLFKYRPGSFKYYFHRARIDMHARRGNDSFFQKRGFTIDDWARWRGASLPAVAVDEALRALPSKVHTLEDVMQPGDVICILGALWDNPKLDALYARYAQQGGAQIYAMVHDTIPLLLPETVHVNPVVFYDWLKAAGGYCTGILANSQCTARDVAFFLNRLGVEIPVHLTCLAQAPLPKAGGEAAPVESADPVAQDLARIKDTYRRRKDIRDATKLPFVLSVGTIEARKNCWRMAQAWARLSQEPDVELPRLVFAGKRGWLNDDFLEAYKATGGWGGWVHIIEQPSDDDLAFLYRRCAFTITASLYEGWGLPIGESLSYGKTGVVSNISAMPEVGGDMVEYCDPHSITSIADAVRRLASDPEHKAALEARIADAQLRQWSDVGADVARALTAAAPAKRQATG